MKKQKIFWSVAIVLASMTLGCVQRLDPVTGEQSTVLREDVATKIDAVAEAAPGIAALLAMFIPMLYPGIGIVGGAAGMWAKLRPKLKTARTEAETYFVVTEGLVAAIDKYKADNPNEWAKLRDVIGGQIGDNSENVIRALRGLPPKD